MRLHAYPKLSTRQIQVYDMLITDMTPDEIADTLSLSKSGVKFHINIILSKTKCNYRWKLIARHYQHQSQELAA